MICANCRVNPGTAHWTGFGESRITRSICPSCVESLNAIGMAWQVERRSVERVAFVPVWRRRAGFGKSLDNGRAA